MKHLKHLKHPRRRLISAVGISVTLLGSALATSTAVADDSAPPQSAPPAAESPSASAEGLIVGYKSSASEQRSDKRASEDAKAKAREAGESLKFERRLSTGAALVELDEEKTPAELADVIEAFQDDPDVAYVEPDTRILPLATPNDPEYNRQWDLFEATAGMRVPDAWDTTTGSGVTVAVLDTGYVAHSDLAANIVPGYDFVSNAANARDGDGRDSDPSDEGDWFATHECGFGIPGQSSSWHGTHVAGTIAAETDNDNGIAGIAGDARIQPVRVLAKCGGTTSDIVDAITWASGGDVSGVPANTDPAQIINMSLGGASSCSPTWQNAINGAVDRGTSVVVAAGNSNADAANFVPASCDNVISVAATNRSGDRSFYSNFGATVDIAAPGGETRTGQANGIYSTLNSGTTTPATESYAYYQGTSMAAPHIAGLAALMKSANASLTPAQIESAIKDSARPLPGSCSGGCGAGLADAASTVQTVADGLGVPGRN